MGLLLGSPRGGGAGRLAGGAQPCPLGVGAEGTRPGYVPLGDSTGGPWYDLCPDMWHAQCALHQVEESLPNTSLCLPGCTVAPQKASGETQATFWDGLKGCCPKTSWHGVRWPSPALSAAAPPR